MPVSKVEFGFQPALRLLPCCPQCAYFLFHSHQEVLRTFWLHGYHIQVLPHRGQIKIASTDNRFKPSWIENVFLSRVAFMLPWTANFIAPFNLSLYILLLQFFCQNTTVSPVDNYLCSISHTLATYPFRYDSALPGNQSQTAFILLQSYRE